eukprot:11678545-Alexandrium_andersonii.AAC.2
MSKSPSQSASNAEKTNARRVRLSASPALLAPQAQNLQRRCPGLAPSRQFDGRSNSTGAKHAMQVSGSCPQQAVD